MKRVSGPVVEDSVQACYEDAPQAPKMIEKAEYLWDIIPTYYEMSTYVKMA